MNTLPRLTCLYGNELFLINYHAQRWQHAVQAIIPQAESHIWDSPKKTDLDLITQTIHSDSLFSSGHYVQINYASEAVLKAVTGLIADWPDDVYVLITLKKKPAILPTGANVIACYRQLQTLRPILQNMVKEHQIIVQDAELDYLLVLYEHDLWQITGLFDNLALYYAHMVLDQRIVEKHVIDQMTAGLTSIPNGLAMVTALLTTDKAEISVCYRKFITQGIEGIAMIHVLLKALRRVVMLCGEGQTPQNRFEAHYIQKIQTVLKKQGVSIFSALADFLQSLMHDLQSGIFPMSSERSFFCLQRLQSYIF